MAEQFRIEPVSTPGGDDSDLERAFRLQPPDTLQGDEGLVVTDLIERTETEIRSADISLDLLLKHVRFDDTDIADHDIVGGMPIAEDSAAPPGSLEDLTEGAVSPPGVPGTIGELSGQLPVPVQVTDVVERTYEVTVHVRWRILDDSGQVIEDVAWTLGSGGGSTDGTGGEIAPSPDRALDTLTVTFPPLFVELSTDPEPTVQRRIAASVQLSAAGAITERVKLPSVDVELPAVPVPTILGLFVDRNFDGPKLIVVPSDSPLGRDDLAGALDTLNGTLSSLSAAADFASLFLDSVDDLKAAIDPDDGHVEFRRADSIPNLNDITLVQRNIFRNDTEAEDELSSAILVGPPRRAAECYNAKNFNTGEGQMNVVVGDELLVLVDDLHSASPASEPGGRVNVPVTPQGSRFAFHDITSFGDELSSVRFGWG